MQSITKNATALALGGVVAQLAFVAIEVLIARTLGNQAYGVFASVYMLVLTLTLVVDMGLTWYSVDRGSREPSSIPILMGTTTVLKMALFVIAYPVLLVVLPKLGIDKVAISFLTIFYFYAVILSFQDSLAAVNSARQSMHISAIFQGLGPLVVGILVLVTSIGTINLNIIAACYLGGTGLITLYWWFYTQRIEKPTVQLKLIPGILKESSWYGMTNVLAQLFYKSDILLLTVFATMTQVGIYAAGYKILDVAYKIPILAVRVFSPPLFKLWKDNRDGYTQIADIFMRFSLASGGGLSIFCLFASHDIISAIFGEQYSDAAIVLQILSASFILKFLANCLQTMLSTMGLHQSRTKYLAIATLIMIVLQFFLIPEYGAIGAAVSVVIADTILCAMFAWVARYSNIREKIIGNIIRCALIIAVSIGFTLLLGLSGILAALLACAIFTIVVLATGFVSLSDVKLLSTSTSLSA